MPRVRPGERRRAYSSKSRSGCRTCKIRRIKCDEGKPQCRRCTSTGRTCDGYELVIEHQEASLIPISATPSTNVFTSWREFRAFDFFRAKTIPDLSGNHVYDLWDRILPQAAHFDVGIRHGLLALASIHESFAGDQTKSVGAEAFALEQYNLAIRHHVKSLLHPKQSDSLEAYLVSCLIFICIEALRGHYGSALSLVKQGLGILQGSKFDLNTSDSSPWPSDTIESILDQLTLQARSLMGGSNLGDLPTTKHGNHLSNIPNAFSSITEAKDSLDHNIYTYICTVQKMQKIRKKYQISKIGSPHDPDIFETSTDTTIFSKLVKDAEDPNIVLGRWDLALKNFLRYRGGYANLQRHEQDAFKVLQIQKLMIAMALDMLSDIPVVDNQMLWDKYLPICQQVIELAEEVLDVPQMEPQSASSSTPDSTSSQTRASPFEHATLPYTKITQKTFTLDIGLIAPLYDIACRCRDPFLRRRAIYLLRVSGRQEGIWDSSLAAHVAERIVAIEEDGLGMDPEKCTSESSVTPQCFYPPRIKCAADVPDSARLSHMIPKFNLDVNNIDDEMIAEKKMRRANVLFARLESPSGVVREAVREVLEW